MKKAAQFLEEYANTPIGEMSVDETVKVLQRSGILTKNRTVAAKYAQIVVITDPSKGIIKTEKPTVHQERKD